MTNELGRQQQQTWCDVFWGSASGSHQLVLSTLPRAAQSEVGDDDLGVMSRVVE